MGNRRFTQVATSDDEDEVPQQRKRRRLRKKNEEEEEDQGRKQGNDKDKNEESQTEEEELEDAKPIGEVVRVSGKGRSRRTHYESFEHDGTQYDLEDPILLTPEDKLQKPYVAIIKDITQTKEGSLMVTGQWFYRPDEAEKKGGGNWQSREPRELFYSDHRDEVPAESVMHKCVVHFVPLNKQLPIRKESPGFIVQRVYDVELKKLYKLTDKDYEDSLQHEINLLVQKTQARIGELPDLETLDTQANLKDQSKSKRPIRNKNITPLDVTKEEDLNPKGETPTSCTNTANTSEYYTILRDVNALTGDTHRDKWLEKLLRGVHYVFNAGNNSQKDDIEKGTIEAIDSQENNILKVSGSLRWPDDAVSAVSALEKASHDALSSDFLKYNQKMRQLVFNLGNNAALTRRLINGELEASKVLNMSPTELKEGLTAEELSVKEPEGLTHMQMTDARCRQCAVKQVGLLEIIQSGAGARYQLQCDACGHTWYASRDEISTLTIDAPTFIVSPRDSDKPKTATAAVDDKTSDQNPAPPPSTKNVN